MKYTTSPLYAVAVIATSIKAITSNLISNAKFVSIGYVLSVKFKIQIANLF
jgi:hypothetical protein